MGPEMQLFWLGAVFAPFSALMLMRQSGGYREARQPQRRVRRKMIMFSLLEKKSDDKSEKENNLGVSRPLQNGVYTQIDG